MKKIATAALLLLSLTTYAQKTVPLKDNLPYYERAFPVSGSRSDAYNDTKLFFAEYFKRSTPNVVTDDKDGGRYAVRTCLFYHCFANPEDFKGRLLSLMSITFRSDSCFVQLYDWQLQRADQKTKWAMLPNGALMPEGVPVWADQNEGSLVKEAAKGRRVATAELSAVDKEVAKLLDAYQKRL